MTREELAARPDLIQKAKQALEEAYGRPLTDEEAQEANQTFLDLLSLLYDLKTPAATDAQGGGEGEPPFDKSA